MTIEEKKAEIERLNTEQKALIDRIVRISKLKPCNTSENAITRACTVVTLAVRVSQLEMDKYMVLAIPIPKFKEGASMRGISRVEQLSEEIIKSRKN